MSGLGAVPIALLGVGLVTAVGPDAPSSCAAFRAKISNPSETRFIDSTGQWIMGHQVMLAQPWRGLTKLARMAVLAIEEALEHLPRAQWARLQMLLCVAERSRPGRTAGLDNDLLQLIEAELDLRFASASTVAEGRIGVAMALARARAFARV
jgi:3-oxoacyl-[acyl-carrier-protein] synthase I